MSTRRLIPATEANSPVLPLKDQQAINKAVTQGDIKQIRAMLAEQTLKHPANSNVLSCALFCATKRSRVSVVTYLFSQGATVDVRALVATPGSDAMHQLYIDNGVDLNTPIRRGPEMLYPEVYHLTLLSCHICTEPVVRWLLDHGADPNASFEHDITPMTYAIQRAPLATIRLLLERGANVRKGHLMHYAAVRDEECSIEVLELLLHLGLSINAIMPSDIEQLTSRKRLRPIAGDTPLHVAIRSGELGVVSYLLSRGANSTIRNGEGRTARDLAVWTNRRDIIPLLPV